MITVIIITMFNVFDIKRHCLDSRPENNDYVLVQRYSLNLNINVPTFIKYNFVGGGIEIIDNDGNKVYGPTVSITNQPLGTFIRISCETECIKFFVAAYHIEVYLQLSTLDKGIYLPEVTELVTENFPPLVPLISKNKKNITQDYSWPFNFEFYNYQQNNVKWLIQLEKKSSNGNNKVVFPALDSYNLRRIHKNHTELFYNSSSGYVYPLSILDEIDNQEYKLCGGLLCDEVGLGKTFTALGLILNTLDKELVFDVKKPTKKMLTDRDKKLKVIKNPDKTPQYKTDATLVFAPARLISQWNTEADKFLLPQNNIRKNMITTITQYRKTSVKIICNSDIIFVAYRFLTNASYLKFIDKENGHKLSDFYWKRVIIDEGHEVCKSNTKFHELLNGISSKYRWVFSGTPFADGYDNLDNYLSYLSNGKYVSSYNHWKKMSLDDINKFLWTNTRRNTYNSVKDQIHIPPIVQKTVLLKQHKVERALYVNAVGNPTRMIQLCTNIMASSNDLEMINNNEGVSLEQVREQMEKHYQQEIDKATKNLEMCRNEKGVAKQLYDNAGDHFAPNTEQWRAYRQMQKGNITSWKKQIKSHKNTIVSMTSRKKLFDDINDKIENEECPICYGDMDSAVLTKCGHLCCEDCMKQIIDDMPHNIRCPICRTTLQKIDIGYMREEEEEEDGETDYYKNVNKWGTKMAWLVQYLDKLLSSDKPRVIIFSQWKNVLKLVGKVLTEHNINKVYLQGTSAQMASSINKFKTNNKIRVIMLSSDTASSGSNLTEASHVILLDTVNGTAGKAKAIEDQAIGRANRLGQNKKVQVVRLIMKNTIEHDYYKVNIEHEDVTEIDGGKDIYI